MMDSTHTIAGIVVTSMLFCASAPVLAQSGNQSGNQSGDAPAAEAAEERPTQDIVYMNDGRKLTGEILSEARESIEFRYVDRAINVATTLNLQKSSISKIERDVPLEMAELAGAAATATASSGKAVTHDERAATFGARLADQDNMDAPLVYVVPMHGQMGTDIHLDVYKEIKKDIEKIRPDILVLALEVTGKEDGWLIFDAESADLNGLQYLDMYRELVSLFHDDLRSIPQVLWVSDSQGISSAIALAWDEMYMKPQAHFAGLRQAAANFEFLKGDENIYTKYREAFMATLRGFAENSAHEKYLVDAMVRPEFTLSATWKGRDVKWDLNSTGEYIVDSSEQATVSFTAKTAEDLRISKGTAETLDDLMLLMGIREYRLADGRAEQIYTSYTENWRRSYEGAASWMDDYAQFMGWANGEDALKYLGQAKNALERVKNVIERYPAAEIRLGMDYGISKQNVEFYIMAITEQIRMLRDAGRNGGGGGRGMGGGGGRTR